MKKSLIMILILSILTTLFTVKTQPSAVAITDGLIAFYNFEDPNYPGKDVSGTGNHLYYSEQSSTKYDFSSKKMRLDAGETGSAAYFNGTDGLVSLLDSAGLDFMDKVTGSSVVSSSIQNSSSSTSNSIVSSSKSEIASNANTSTFNESTNNESSINNVSDSSTEENSVSSSIKNSTSGNEPGDALPVGFWIAIIAVVIALIATGIYLLVYNKKQSKK